MNLNQEKINSFDRIVDINFKLSQKNHELQHDFAKMSGDEAVTSRAIDVVLAMQNRQLLVQKDFLNGFFNKLDLQYKTQKLDNNIEQRQSRSQMVDYSEGGKDKKILRALEDNFNQIEDALKALE